MTFAARDSSPRRGVSDEHIRSGSVRSEHQSLGEKDLPPSGLRRIWPVASLLVGYSPKAGMRPPRASPQAKLGATNVIVLMPQTTKDVAKEVFPADLREHRAVQAWSRLAPQRIEPETIEVLRLTRKKSAVYRMTGVGPHGAAVVAKRCRTMTASVERVIYETVL